MLVAIVAGAGLFAYHNYGNQGNSALVLKNVKVMKAPPCPPLCAQVPNNHIWLYGMRTNICTQTSCGEDEVLESNTDGTQWSQVALWGQSISGLADLVMPNAGGMYFSGAFRDFSSYSLNPMLGKSSTDGTTWVSSANPAWFPKVYYATAQTDPASSGTKYAYILGGSNGTNLKNDVWRSADGINWTQMTAAAQWPVRYEATAVGLGNKIYIMGGQSATAGTNYNDVWSSADGGATWMQATAHAPWSTRNQLSSVAYNGAIWILGGDNNSSDSDVWKSTDGANWTEVTASAPWGRLNNPCVLVFNHALFLIGGNNASQNHTSSLVWSSTDGLNWTQKADLSGLAIGGIPAAMCSTIPYAVN